MIDEADIPTFDSLVPLTDTGAPLEHCPEGALEAALADPLVAVVLEGVQLAVLVGQLELGGRLSYSDLVIGDPERRKSENGSEPRGHKCNKDISFHRSDPVKVWTV